MATIAPSFSFLLIVTFQIIFQGRMASTMSNTPEYTIATVSESHQRKSVFDFQSTYCL